jgi:hypothetical protein
MGMIADDMSCPGSGGNQGSLLPELSANDEKDRFNLETLQNVQDSSVVQRVGVVQGFGIIDEWAADRFLTSKGFSRTRPKFR